MLIIHTTILYSLKINILHFVIKISTLNLIYPRRIFMRERVKGNRRER